MIFSTKSDKDNDKSSIWTDKTESYIVVVQKKKGVIFMTKSFYHFLMKYRHPEPKDDISRFANHAFQDHGFPKNSTQYDELSSYLELNVHYLESMAIFDEAWNRYLEETK